jgi:hypothetical protein
MSHEERAADSGDFVDRIDEVLDASFPASDPPPWTLGYRPRVPTRPQGDDRPKMASESHERPEDTNAGESKDGNGPGAS